MIYLVLLFDDSLLESDAGGDSKVKALTKGITGIKENQSKKANVDVVRFLKLNLFTRYSISIS